MGAGCRRLINIRWDGLLLNTTIPKPDPGPAVTDFTDWNQVQSFADIISGMQKSI